MTLESLEGAAFGPHPYRTCREKVGEYVAATLDDPERWVDHAPPGIAGAILFAVTGDLLAAAGESARSIIHGEQSFTWHAPIPVEADLEVSGTVGRIRTRGPVAFVGFDLLVTGEDGPLLEGASTFLMSGEAPPAGGAEEEPEPGPDERGQVDSLPSDPGAGPVARSASRADLVRYAAASRDWNAIHWDHDAAVAAGLPGIVVHGLLQSAWVCSVAATGFDGPRPLAGAKFRYRAPLRPAVPASVTTSAGDAGAWDVALVAGDVTFLTSTVRGVTG
jgi:acyl dehydratase